jgi:hypothetical protein
MQRLGEESAIIERQNQELEALLRHKSMLAQRLERVWSKPKLSEKPSRASGRRFYCRHSTRRPLLCNRVRPVLACEFTFWQNYAKIFR